MTPLYAQDSVFLTKWYLSKFESPCSSNTYLRVKYLRVRFCIFLQLNTFDTEISEHLHPASVLGSVVYIHHADFTGNNVNKKNSN